MASTVGTRHSITNTLFVVSAALFLTSTATAHPEALLSNLHQDGEPTKSSPFTGANGKAVDFTLKDDHAFVVSDVVLRLQLGTDSRPKLRLVEITKSGQLALVPPGHAAGLDIPGETHAFRMEKVDALEGKESVDVRFVPEQTLVLQAGASYRLALSTDTKKDPMLWLAGGIPKDGNSMASHTGQVYGRGNPTNWHSLSEVVNLYEIKGRRTQDFRPRPEVEPQADTGRPGFSGVYPHLAMFNTTAPTECGIGAVVHWADRLWAVTYSPYHPHGSPDKLFQIDRELNISTHPESVGGTPANRMIHEESDQLLIGPYLIDQQRKVRVIPPRLMPGRLTGTARHLTDPANKVYYATMEEGFYEVDVNSLEVKSINRDRSNFAHGNHGKGLYSGQGRVIYANNGGSGHKGRDLWNNLNRDFKEVGSLNQWNGNVWQEIHRTGFLDVTGPGGIRGNPNPDTDPVWSIGWDYRSVILKVLDSGEWHSYRLPKASHTMDGPHGFNTEWPRIGEIGSDDERLIYVHGMFWRFPNDFSTKHSLGLRPRSTYLKMVSDSTLWNDRIVFACNDLSNEPQAIRLNPRKIRGSLIPSISHSNLWFVEPDRIDEFGVPLGRGSVWMNDQVSANQPSDAFQFGGWDHRMLHLSHESDKAVRFEIELDRRGNGKWTPWNSFTVPAKGYLPVSFKEAPSAEWVRLKPDHDAEGVVATFHFANRDGRPQAATPLFDGIARPEDADVMGGLVRIRSTHQAPLGLATSDSRYYEMGTDMKLKPVKDPDAEAELRSIAKIPDPMTGGLTHDEASVIYTDVGKRYRLPRGDRAFDKASPLGMERVDREVVRERNLFNTHGTLFELPYRNAGGFSLIRPVTTHNRRIKDFCTWRGLFVISGIDASTENPHIIRSADGKAAVWLGVVDDLWRMGKVRGFGGPWLGSEVRAGIPSDPYLMNGYDRKELTLSHQGTKPITMRIEVDVTGYGDWQAYRDFVVDPAKEVRHLFPEDFSAYWVRAVSEADTTGTAQFRYD